MVIENMRCTDDLSASNQIEPASGNDAIINDIIEDDNFEITLSVSTKEARTKENAKKVNDFTTQTYTVFSESRDLTELFQTRLYSTNTWSSGCSNDAYVGMTGVTLDFDYGFTIGEAQTAFADYNYILHTSRTHQYGGDGTPEDRFRVILPFEPGGLYFTTESEARRVYDKLMELYPHADKMCTNPGRKFFPSTRELDTPFQLDVHFTGEYFSIDISDVPDYAPRTRGLYVPPTELNTREELDRMLKFDQFVPWCQAQAGKGLLEPLWHAMISNLCRFTGGPEMIHETSAKDPVLGRYDFEATEDKIQHALESSGPIGYEEIVRRGYPGPVPKAPLSPAGWAKVGRIFSRNASDKDGTIHIRYDDELIVTIDGYWTVVTFERVKTELLSARHDIPCCCPFCDADDAIISRDSFNFVNMVCSSCQVTCWEHPFAPSLFTYKNQVLRVEQREGQFSSIEVMGADHFRTKSEYQYVKKRLANSQDRRFLDDNFQIRRIGDAGFNSMSYAFDVRENAVVFNYPALPEELCDNAFIDRFLNDMFGQYATFIRDWMAMYCYTNYVNLPVIILAGKRGTGKGTFVNMVWNIFPTLAAHWTGETNHFNDNYRCKLLFVDENKNSEKPAQYTEIKKITGNPVVRINEKFKPEYHVPNNIKIIMSTNDPRPIFLRSEEQPTSEANNNFFIYECPALGGPINEKLGEELKKRLGHFVRSELKTRYENLVKTRGNHNRYGIPTPITPFARNLFTSAKTTIELEIDELASALLNGVSIPQKSGFFESTYDFTPYRYNGDCYVKFKEIRDLVKHLGLKGAASQPKAYVTKLQDIGILSHDTARSATEHLGYKILRPKDYYTTTISGMVQEVNDINDESARRCDDFHHELNKNKNNALDIDNDENDESDTHYLTKYLKER